MQWSVSELAGITAGRLLKEGSHEKATGISTDTRSLLPENAFLAIRGPHFDGHHFAKEASARGASCLVVEEGVARSLIDVEAAVLAVGDTMEALARLAAHARDSSSIPWVATTGSAGKTTTKEYIAAALSSLGPVLKAPASFNNNIGVPMSILGLMPEHVAAAIEIGTNAPGEIAALARLARPTVAVITNVGPAHLERFGSVAAIAHEKADLLRCMDHRGVAVLPADSLESAALRAAAPGRVVTFGLSPVADVRAEAVTFPPEGGVCFATGGVEVRLEQNGLAAVRNALAAIAAAEVLDVARGAAAELVSGVPPPPMRGVLRRGRRLILYEDCYNANPLSFGAALQAWSLSPHEGRRWVVAGDMLELGDAARPLHQELGRHIARSGAEQILAVGEFSEEIAYGAIQAGMPEESITYVPTVTEAMDRARALARDGDFILVKGSRAVGLERVVEDLLAV